MFWYISVQTRCNRKMSEHIFAGTTKTFDTKIKHIHICNCQRVFPACKSGHFRMCFIAIVCACRVYFHTFRSFQVNRWQKHLHTWVIKTILAKKKRKELCKSFGTNHNLCFEHKIFRITINLLNVSTQIELHFGSNQKKLSGIHVRCAVFAFSLEIFSI